MAPSSLTWFSPETFVSKHPATAKPFRSAPPHSDMILSQFAANSARHGASVLSIAATRKDGRVHLGVADDGPGITTAHRERIFEPFFTTARDAGGTGMGLAIVRETVRTAGGDVVLLPDGPGARFEIVF